MINEPKELTHDEVRKMGIIPRPDYEYRVIKSNISSKEIADDYQNQLFNIFKRQQHKFLGETVEAVRSRLIKEGFIIFDHKWEKRTIPEFEKLIEDLKKE